MEEIFQISKLEICKTFNDRNSTGLPTYYVCVITRAHSRKICLCCFSGSSTIGQYEGFFLRISWNSCILIGCYNQGHCSGYLMMLSSIGLRISSPYLSPSLIFDNSTSDNNILITYYIITKIMHHVNLDIITIFYLSAATPKNNSQIYHRFLLFSSNENTILIK